MIDHVIESRRLSTGAILYMDIPPGCPETRTPRCILVGEETATSIVKMGLRDVEAGFRLSFETQCFCLSSSDISTLRSAQPNLVVIAGARPEEIAGAVAKWKQAPDLQHIPVVVWATWRHEDDPQAATMRMAGADAFIEMPMRYGDLLMICQDLVGALAAAFEPVVTVIPRATVVGRDTEPEAGASLNPRAA